MKKLLLLLALFSLFSCSTDNEIEDDNNLISNSSFEKNSEFSLLGWDGALTSPSTDTPENGGSYSLQLEPATFQIDPPHEGYVETHITELQGTVTLHYSCDVKVNSTSSISGYIIILKENQNGERTEISYTPFNNTQWNNISFDINTVLDSSDSLVIHLSAGACEINEVGTILFDNVKLTQ